MADPLQPSEQPGLKRRRQERSHRDRRWESGGRRPHSALRGRMGAYSEGAAARREPAREDGRLVSITLACGLGPAAAFQPSLLRLLIARLKIVLPATRIANPTKSPISDIANAVR